MSKRKPQPTPSRETSCEALRRAASFYSATAHLWALLGRHEESDAAHMAAATADHWARISRAHTDAYHADVAARTLEKAHKARVEVVNAALARVAHLTDARRYVDELSDAAQALALTFKGGTK